uniref:PiggyBac transposable element n=1 Tax=Trachysalambria curvirostris majanivirus TaxID=2984281 RepID=A0A9C7CFL1_9VIRU|nr:MAG: piggyBac transposable element [Trachysalambria curvirostris majanivirus]
MGIQKKMKMYYKFNDYTGNTADIARSKIHSRYTKLNKLYREIDSDDSQEIDNDDDSEDDYGIVIDDKSPHDYLSHYIPGDIISNLSRGTNMKIRDNQNKGSLADVDDTTIRRFLGVNLMMSVIKYPQLHLYWMGNTKVSGIADSMSLDEFMSIIKHLQFDYNSENNHNKSDDKLLKFRPLLDSIKMRCKQLPVPSKVAVAMMVMSFDNGFQKIEIMKKNMDVPTGLVTFVLIAPDGRLLDIEFYQSYDKLIEAVKNTKLDISDYDDLSMGEAAVLRFIKSVRPGTMFFFGEEFTTLRLLDILDKHNMGGTGIIAEKHIPHTIKNFSTINFDQHVIEDGNNCIISWQSLYFASTVLEVESTKSFLTLCMYKGQEVISEKSKRPDPNIVCKYYEYIQGVDIFRSLFVCDNSSFRTGKDNVDLILTLINIACINSWSEYRVDYPHRNKSRVMCIRSFKVYIADDYMTIKNDNTLININNDNE